MRSNSEFVGLPPSFWAAVKLIGEGAGYTERGGTSKGKVKVPNLGEMVSVFGDQNLDTSFFLASADKYNDVGEKLNSYFSFRAERLNNYVEPRLMDVGRARIEFQKLFDNLQPSAPIPMNKQKKEKKAPAYFTGMINMLIEANSRGYPCDYDPKSLTKFSKDSMPLRTLSRRVDGAFPSVMNPVAIWEIKEYYYTTTFGSRVADGVYESLLDGMELQELKRSEGISVHHYMMIDAHYTWWKSGKSYLCRLIDMIHMGLIDEVLFGYEIIERLPDLVEEWVQELKQKI